MDAREMLNLPTKYKHIINMRITNAHEMYVQLTSLLCTMVTGSALLAAETIQAL